MKKETISCVFHESTLCLVRKEMRKGASTRILDKYLKPLEKGTDETQIIVKYADAMKELLDRFIGEWSTLHYYCEICPIMKLKEAKPSP